MQVPIDLLVPWDINTSPDQCVFHIVSVSTVEWVSCRNIILAPLMSNELKSSLIFTWSAKPLVLTYTILIPVYINHYKSVLPHLWTLCTQKHIYNYTWIYPSNCHARIHTTHIPFLCAMASITPHEICINALIMGHLSLNHIAIFPKGC